MINQVIIAKPNLTGSIKQQSIQFNEQSIKTKSFTRKTTIEFK